MLDEFFVGRAHYPGTGTDDGVSPSQIVNHLAVPGRWLLQASVGGSQVVSCGASFRLRAFVQSLSWNRDICARPLRKSFRFCRIVPAWVQVTDPGQVPGEMRDRRQR